MAAKNPLHVRGVCPKCRGVVDTKAPPGRATWRGACPVQDCTGQVIAKRVRPPTTPAPPPAAPDTPPAPAGRQRRKAVKAGDYDRAQAPSGAPRVRRTPATSTGPAPTPGPGTDPAAGQPADPGPTGVAPAAADPEVAGKGREPQRPARSPVPEQRRHTITGGYGHLY